AGSCRLPSAAPLDKAAFMELVSLGIKGISEIEVLLPGVDSKSLRFAAWGHRRWNKCHNIATMKMRQDKGSCFSSFAKMKNAAMWKCWLSSAQVSEASWRASWSLHFQSGIPCPAAWE